MTLRHLKPNRFILLLGAFLAFIIIAAPNAARAQDTCQEGGDFYTSYGSTLGTMATRMTNIHADFLKKAVTLDAEHYCMTTLLKAIDLVHGIMASTDSYYAIFEGIVMSAIQNIISQLCGILTSLINDLTSVLNNSLYLSICVPLPQLHLGTIGMPTHSQCTISLFGGKTPLAGVGLKPMQQPPTQPSTPNYWDPWGAENKQGGFQTYVPGSH